MVNFSCCLMSSRKASEIIVFEDPDLKYRQKNDKGILKKPNEKKNMKSSFDKDG